MPEASDNPSPLLDFLYPRRTHPLLRRQSLPSLPLRPRATWPACAVSQKRDGSNEASNRPIDKVPKLHAQEVANEETPRHFDHTQWERSGSPVSPKTSYTLEEDDPQPDRRKRQRAAQETETLLDVARSKTKHIDSRLNHNSIADQAAVASRGRSQQPLVDVELENELRQHLKAQIAAEEALEEPEEKSGTSYQLEALQSMVWEELDDREPQAQLTTRVAKSPGSAVSGGELPADDEPRKVGENTPVVETGTTVKRTSRFSAPQEKPGLAPKDTHQPGLTGELQRETVPAPLTEAKKPTTIYEMLEDVEGGHFHDVHDAHARLNDKERDRLRVPVLTYLAKSRSIVEAARVKTLFNSIPVERWTNEMLSAVVLVFLRTNEQTRAFDAFRTGIKDRGLTGGLEYLLIDSVNKHQWHTALDAWLLYCKDLAQRHPNKEPDLELLKPFGSLNSLGGLYFLFERYLSAAERRVERFMDAKPLSKKALYDFRRMFAKAALESYCPPKQAGVILDWWHDQHFYNHYIWGMVARWHKKEVSSDTVRELIPIYKTFRGMYEREGIKISESILSCVFAACYPHHAQTLEQLHDDWVRMHGGLDGWGYKKFMKFYAWRGDAERVKELWAKYVEKYPEDSKRPESFSSIVNAYAQCGNMQGAEAEVARMKNQFGIKPDASIMNALLKAHMRKGNYEETLACFGRSLQTFTPNSFMYAHMMAMAAKKGDLDQAIEFFNDAQDRGVTITKEMVLALVVAYCGNGRLPAAEELTKRLADEGVTSTAIWNQIVLQHGKSGRLSRCYEVLDEMKERNIEWDQDTLDNLLQSLTQIKQIRPAYQVLKRAIEEQHTIVRPEHYTSVMMGAARTSDMNTGDAVYELLTKNGIPIPFNALVGYTSLMLDRKPNAQRTSSLPREMVDSLRRYLGSVDKLDLTKRRQQTRMISWCIELLIDYRDFDAIEEVVSIYTQLFPEYKDGHLPPDIIAALMQGYHRDGNHEQVIALWNDSWPRLRRSRVKQGDDEGIYPAHEYDVDRLVFRLADSYRATGTSNGLAAAVEEIHKAGFKLTSHTWDRVIATLAITGNWKTGVHWMETMLMKHWSGWKRKLTLQERRMRANPRFLRPQRLTLLALREGWIAERQLAAWSAPIARSLVQLDIDYPRTVNAFRDALEPMAPGGPWILSTDITMEQLIKPLPLKELKMMDRELSKYLEDEEKVLDREKSPFRVMMEKEDRLRSLDWREMTRLKGLLDRVLGHTRRGLEEGGEKSAHGEKLVEGQELASG